MSTALAVSSEALPVEPVPRGGGGTPSPDVDTGVEPPASTAPTPSAGGSATGGSDQGGRERKRSKKGDDEGERGARLPASPAEPAAAVLAEQASGTDAASDESDGDSTGVIVAAGLGGLALALGGGWFLYRRRLP